MTVRKAARVPFGPEVADPAALARLLSQVQAAVGATLDQLVQRANGATLASGDGHQVAWLPAPPAAGPWSRGDVVWSTLAAAGGPPGWVCVAGGAPGTWKAMANLAP